MRWMGWAAGLAAGLTVWGAPPLTTIQDTLYRADGAKFNGIVQISWTSFESGNTVFVAANSKTVRIIDGVLRVSLIPTENTTPAAFYTVRYWGGGRVQFSETWSVPATSSILKVRDVRTSGPLWPAGPPAGSAEGGAIEISQVNGLQSQLDSRPVKASPFQPLRVVMVNSDGQLASVTPTQAPSDCVLANGSTAPCGSVIQFVDNETPGGLVDGVNLTFTLAHPPNPASSVMLFRNGLLQRLTVDFTLTGSTIQFVAGATPQPGDVLVASYRK